MRNKLNLNQLPWKFKKDCSAVPDSYPRDWESVSLPHTWNAMDGQDGGNDYFRGACMYTALLPELPRTGHCYLEIEAASLTADVFVNGKQVTRHEGGYSAFRADLSPYLSEEDNLLCIRVDNSSLPQVYPHMADFTFFGGLYRNVSLIVVPESHFLSDYHGTDYFFCTPTVEDGKACIHIDVKLVNPQKQDILHFEITDADGAVCAHYEEPAANAASVHLTLEQPHLWNGMADPYLYRASASLLRDGRRLDSVSASIGLRSFSVDPEKGFFLNGRPLPLRGVSRHQDREDKGYVLSAADQQEDAGLIREMGANTIRLAHYQHSRFFYDLCDQMGFVVWAEIPFISVMREEPEAHENCRSQLTELILQNYHHPSICFWGIANEITIGNAPAELEKRLEDLNLLAHCLDPCRLTTLAQFTMLPTDSPLNFITDVLSYNHYYGWYMGKFEDNEAWLDEFHRKYPDRPIGISEYGCEGIPAYHNDEPARKDYSEEYQALYHEHMAEIISRRPWLWATHVWNMFDFAADSRDEGGVKGRNNKGLVTMNRQTKKDSFFLYKSYWSDEPFVHICGRRYVQRANGQLVIKLYSNQPSVTLYLDDTLLGERHGGPVFLFEEVPLPEGRHTLTARAGECEDQIHLERVQEPNPDYRCPESDAGGNVANWFEGKNTESAPEMTFHPEFFSVRDTLRELLADETASEALVGALSSMMQMPLNRGSLGIFADSTIEQIRGVLDADKVPCGYELLNQELQKIRKKS